MCNFCLAKQFSRYVKAGIGADDLEGVYETAHASIRASPERLPKKADAGAKTWPKSNKMSKHNLKQRRNRIKQLTANTMARNASMAD